MQMRQTQTTQQQKHLRILYLLDTDSCLSDRCRCVPSVSYSQEVPLTSHPDAWERAHDVQVQQLKRLLCADLCVF